MNDVHDRSAPSVRRARVTRPGGSTKRRRCIARVLVADPRARREPASARPARRRARRAADGGGADRPRHGDHAGQCDPSQQPGGRLSRARPPTRRLRRISRGGRAAARIGRAALQSRDRARPSSAAARRRPLIIAAPPNARRTGRRSGIISPMRWPRRARPKRPRRPSREPCGSRPDLVEAQRQLRPLADAARTLERGRGASGGGASARARRRRPIGAISPSRLQELGGTRTRSLATSARSRSSRRSPTRSIISAACCRPRATPMRRSRVIARRSPPIRAMARARIAAVHGRAADPLCRRGEVAARRARYAAALEALVARRRGCGRPPPPSRRRSARRSPFSCPIRARTISPCSGSTANSPAASWRARVPPRRSRAPPAPGERIRLGIVSGFFCRHTVFRLFLESWLARLDRARFEVIGFHTGKTEDADTARAARWCDRFPREPSTPEAWREAIVAAAPHVLLYPEIGMDPVAGWLAAQRLAPVQCMAWGQPETSGHADDRLFPVERADGAGRTRSASTASGWSFCPISACITRRSRSRRRRSIAPSSASREVFRSSGRARRSTNIIRAMTRRSRASPRRSAAANSCSSPSPRARR